MRLLLVLGLLSSLLTSALPAQERAPRREGPPRAELRERLREAAERMPRLRERLEERRGEVRERLRERLREFVAERRQREARGERRPEGGARLPHDRPRFRDGARRAAGSDENRRPLLPPQTRERLLRALREAGPRQRGGERPPRPLDRRPPRDERRDRRSV